MPGTVSARGSGDEDDGAIVGRCGRARTIRLAPEALDPTCPTEQPDASERIPGVTHGPQGRPARRRDSAPGSSRRPRRSPRRCCRSSTGPRSSTSSRSAPAPGSTTCCSSPRRASRPSRTTSTAASTSRPRSRTRARTTSSPRSATSPSWPTIHSVRQGEPLGLGHAVLMAAGHVAADESFAVLLGDDIVDPGVPFLERMIEAHERTGRPVVALMEVPHDQVHLYGVADVEAGRARRRVPRHRPGREAAGRARRPPT